MQINRKRKSDRCTVCNSPLNGRKDKVFCGRVCQNLHHKETKEAIYYLTERESKRVRRNCVILEGVVTDSIKKIKIDSDALFEHGFDLNSFENENWKGNKRIRYIGPFAFWLLKNGMICIKRRKKSWIKNPQILRRWEVEFLWLKNEENTVYNKIELDESLNSESILTVIPFKYKASKHITDYLLQRNLSSNNPHYNSAPT